MGWTVTSNGDRWDLRVRVDARWQLALYKGDLPTGEIYVEMCSNSDWSSNCKKRLAVRSDRVQWLVENTDRYDASNGSLRFKAGAPKVDMRAAWALRDAGYTIAQVAGKLGLDTSYMKNRFRKGRPYGCSKPSTS